MLIIIGKVPAHDPQCTYTSNITRVLEGKKCKRNVRIFGGDFSSLVEGCGTLQGEGPSDVPEAVDQGEAVALGLWLPLFGTDPEQTQKPSFK